MKKQIASVLPNASLEEVLLAFRRKISDVLRKEADNLQCPMSHIDALVYIAEKGEPSMKDIAAHLKITPPSTTAIIEAMQKKELIKRVMSDTDRRTIRVALTPEAWKLFKTFHEHKFAIFTKMLSKLKDADKTELIRILTILITE